jgi:hypothetical protein
MRDSDVPQDRALFGGLSEIRYAVDEKGAYVLVGSEGWEPSNLANAQAWEVIRDEVESVLARVHEGELSPLAWHMARLQMDAGLLAGYAGLFRWQVRRHRKAAPFRRLSPAVKRRYAAALRLPVEALETVPPPRAEGERP